MKLLSILNEIKIDSIGIEWDKLEPYYVDENMIMLGDKKYLLDVNTQENLLFIYPKNYFYNVKKLTDSNFSRYAPLMKQMFEDGDYKIIK